MIESEKKINILHFPVVGYLDLIDMIAFLIFVAIILIIININFNKSMSESKKILQDPKYILCHVLG